DSLVFGGNFLHGLNIEMEVRVAELETAMGIEPKYQFPGFRDMLWFVVGSAYKVRQLAVLPQWAEVEQLTWLADYLQGEVEKQADLRDPPHSDTEDDIPSAWLTC
ncbi:Kdm2b, partial [Symbiodinium sp. KB8]